MLRRHLGPSLFRQLAQQHAGVSQQVCTFIPAFAAVQHNVGVDHSSAAATVIPSRSRGFPPVPELLRTPSGQLGTCLTSTAVSQQTYTSYCYEQSLYISDLRAPGSFASAGSGAAVEGHTEGTLLKVLLFGAFIAVAVKLAPLIGKAISPCSPSMPLHVHAACHTALQGAAFCKRMQVLPRSPRR